MSEFDEYVEQYIRDYEEIREIYQKNVIETFDPQDYNNYIQDLFTAHSCAIEGNSIFCNDTRELREHSLNLKLYNKSLCEAFEILDHFKAYEYVMKHLDSLLSEEFIKKIHFILTEHTIEYRSKFGKPGEYTTLDMAAGDTLFGDHRENIALVPKLLAQTQRILEEKTLHPMVLAAQFHRFFIYLHPFADGNGRLGRLLSNFILAQNKLPLIIIPVEAKKRLYRCLEILQKTQNPYSYYFLFLQNRYRTNENEIAQRKI